MPQFIATLLLPARIAQPSCPALRTQRGISRIFEALAISALCMASVSQAQPVTNAAATGNLPDSVYIQIGRAKVDSQSVNAGVTLPWNWPATVGKPDLVGYFDLYTSQRTAGESQPGPHHYLVVGVTRALRWRFDEGRPSLFA